MPTIRTGPSAGIPNLPEWAAVEIRGLGYHYRTLIGSNLIEQIGNHTPKHMSGKTCAVITDTNVGPLFANRAKRSLTSAGFKPTLITIPAGEKSKTLRQAGAICEQMIAAGLDRQSFVIGLGGGVIGDISGFVAAIYHRGIPHIQIPTTLLAMVDSSIGGKTGVNTNDGKNLLGVIHQPSLVIDDVAVLKTLPRREFNQGFAEIIKHAIIADTKMFGILQGWKASEAPALKQLVLRNVKIKSRFVGKDEHDLTGKRALLNFGHTVGHAIERAGNYRKFLHGEALSLGIVAACAVSIKRAGLPPRQRDAVIDVLRRFELPTCLPKNFPRNKIVSAVKFDKKFQSGKIRFVVTPRIGAAYLTTDVMLDDIREAVDAL
ncbi:MAG: 3-dehydroquinate synthase [Candidatus Udaeobacter sp.]|nr:MAG: 3-dehydroquinate synthase [Candidatus Udaeobacter sp.]